MEENNMNSNAEHVDEKGKILLIKYSFIKKCMVLFFRLLGVFIGGFFILNDNIFVNFAGILFLIFGICSFLANIFFNKMIFYDNKIETKWNIFGFKFSKKLLYINIEVTKINSVFGGSIMFWEKNNRWKTVYFFAIDLLPVNSEKIKKIKKILIEKQVIKGDENEWID